MPNSRAPKRYALWTITENGLRLADRLAATLDEVDIYTSASIGREGGAHIIFDRLSRSVTDMFHQYQSHVFFMSAGITVRIIAALIRQKTTDPAVVVVDDAGKHAVSLLSGHIGGANRLTEQVARCLDAVPVITTATDVNRLPAIDVWASDKGLTIENPEAIRHVSMAFLRGEEVLLHDPFQIMDKTFPGIRHSALPDAAGKNDAVGIYIDDTVTSLPGGVLVLRPPTLKAGIGCNRGTAKREIRDLLYQVLAKSNLSRSSLAGLASVNIKTDEEGLTALARESGLPLEFFSKTDLNGVAGVQSASAAKKHIGVKSVCEAAAILAARNGVLVVPKKKTANVTVAIARTASISSA